MAILEYPVYPTQPRALRERIDALLADAEPIETDGEVLAMIAPDTNRMANAPAAASLYRAIREQRVDTVVVVAPSHEGTFHRLNICRVDTYHTPFGTLDVDDRVRNELCDEDDDIFLGDEGHFHTEGVDVQLPLLQRIFEDRPFTIVPIVMGDESPMICRELGHAIGEIMYNRPTLLIAAVDVIEATEEALDKLRQAVEEGNVSEVMALTNSSDIEIEGRGCLAVAMLAAERRRADRVRVHHTSLPDADAELPGAFTATFARK